MDDSGVADAFYTALSIGIVLVAAIAVSGIVLSVTTKQGDEAGARMADFGAGGMQKGVYGFYYTVDGTQGDLSSGDPDDIVLRKPALEAVEDEVSFGPGTARPGVPQAMGAIIWSGYLFVPSDGDYDLELDSYGQSWLWMDGTMIADNPLPGVQREVAFTLRLAKGCHPLKAKYFYPDVRQASFGLYWREGGRFVTAMPFYR